MKKVIYSLLVVCLLIAVAVAGSPSITKNTAFSGRSIPNYVGSHNPYISDLYYSSLIMASTSDTTIISILDNVGAPVTCAYINYNRYNYGGTGTSGTIAFSIQPGDYIGSTFYPKGVVAVSAALDSTAIVPAALYKTAIIQCPAIKSDSTGLNHYSGKTGSDTLSYYYSHPSFTAIRVIATAATDTGAYKYWLSFRPGLVEQMVTPNFSADK